MRTIHSRTLQRERRGTPSSFECQMCGETFPVSIGEHGASKKWCNGCFPKVRRQQNKDHYWKDPKKARKRVTDEYWNDPEKYRKLRRENARRHRADPVKNLETNRKRRARNYGLTTSNSSS